MRFASEKMLVWTFGSVVILLFTISLFLVRPASNEAQATHDIELGPSTPLTKAALSVKLGDRISGNEFPEFLDFQSEDGKKQAEVFYTIDQAAQAYIEKLLRRYRPDFGVFVALDASTGEVLAMASRSEKLSDENLALRASFPAASIFKVVSASAAIDSNLATPGTVIPYNGSNHTLYKKNVMSTQTNRWTRKITLQDAFAKSVNTFFGKLGLFHIGHERMRDYAERFYFNLPISADFPIQMGHYEIDPSEEWQLVEAASGFNRKVSMSPVHGALIAAAIANDGLIMEPYLVDRVETDGGEVIYKGEPRPLRAAISEASARDMRRLFEQTVKSGTSRKSFRNTVRRRAFKEIDFGGKTGSLTGLDPRGKCDWFVGYARSADRRIAVAALTVNEEYWRVKSATLASLFFDEILKEPKD